MKASVSALATLLLGASSLPAASVEGGDPTTFTVMSDPILLRPGEVHNRVVKPIALPKEIQDRFRGKNMSVTDVSMDWVFKNGSSVPLSKLYNHHFGVIIGNKAGAEYFYQITEGHDPLAQNPNRSENCQERKLKQPSLAKRLKSMKHQGEAMEELKTYMRQGIPPPGIHIMNLTESKNASLAHVGGPTGNEARHNSFKVPAPFHWTVENPEYFTALYHFINSNNVPPLPGQGQYSPLLECPCTPQRDINKTAITIDGECPSLPYACNGQLLAEENTACSIESYTGGYRCCEDGVFLVDLDDPRYQHVTNGPVSEYYAKFTFTVQEEDSTDPLQEASRIVSDGILDATGGSVEYNIPQCNITDSSDPCVHVLETVVPAPADGARHPYFELVRVAAHLHTGGQRLTLWVEDAGGRYEKGALICDASVENGKLVYGTKEGEAGNELGYLIGIEPCIFGNGEWIFGVNDTVRVRAEYDSTRSHNGVMALWLNAGAGRSSL